MVEQLNYSIKDTGIKLEHRGLEGTIDLILEHNETKKIAFGDIKTTGLINDKWNEFGWEEESLQFKHNLMIQPIHYKILGTLEYGYEPDFFFFIFSNTNTIERKLLKIQLNDERMDEHITYLYKIKSIKEQSEKEGWIPYPSSKGCSKCPINDSCPHFTTVPPVKTIYY